jgi:hypothetical protein
MTLDDIDLSQVQTDQQPRTVDDLDLSQVTTDSVVSNKTKSNVLLPQAVNPKQTKIAPQVQQPVQQTKQPITKENFFNFPSPSDIWKWVVNLSNKVSQRGQKWTEVMKQQAFELPQHLQEAKASMINFWLAQAEKEKFIPKQLQQHFAEQEAKGEKVPDVTDLVNQWYQLEGVNDQTYQENKRANYMETQKQQAYLEKWIDVEKEKEYQSMSKIDQLKAQFSSDYDYSKNHQKKVMVDSEFSDSWFRNMVGWAVAQVPKMLSNLSETWLKYNPVVRIWNYVTSKLTNEDQLQTDLKSMWANSQKAKDEIKKYLGTNPEAISTKVGEMITEIAPTLVWWEATAIEWAVSSIPKLAKLAESAPTLYKVVKNAIVWAVDMEKYAVSSRGEVATPTEAWLWAAIWWAIPLIGKLWQMWAEKLQLSWLMTPKKLEYLSENLINESSEMASKIKKPWDVGKRMIERNIKGTKWSQIEQLEGNATKAKWLLMENLAKSTEQLDIPQATQALQNMVKDMKNVPWMETELANVMSKINPNWKYTLVEAQAIKEDLDRFYNIYKQSWEVSAGIKAQWLNNIRRNVKTAIEQQAEKEWLVNVKMLNNEISMSKWLSEAIKYKEASDLRSELVSFMSWKWAWAMAWGFVWWQKSWRDPKEIIIWAFLWSLVGSTRVKSNLANWMGKLSWFERASLERFVMSNWTKEISAPVVKKLNKFISSQEEALPSKIEKNVVWNNVRPALNKVDNVVVKEPKPLLRKAQLTQTPKAPVKTPVKFEYMSPKDYNASILKSKDMEAHYKQISKMGDEYATMPDDIKAEEEMAMKKKVMSGEAKKDDYMKMEAMTVAEIAKVEDGEQRIWTIAWNKVKDMDFKRNQSKATVDAREKVISKIQARFGMDQFEASNKYDDMNNRRLNNHQPFVKVTSDEGMMPRRLLRDKNVGSGMPAKTDLSPLHEEARKYKSAEEFAEDMLKDNTEWLSVSKESPYYKDSILYAKVHSVDINKIKWTWVKEFDDALRNNKKISKDEALSFVERWWDFKEWKQSIKPIEIDWESMNIFDWKHRLAQALMNWDKQINAISYWTKWWKTLKQIREEANTQKQLLKTTKSDLPTSKKPEETLYHWSDTIFDTFDKSKMKNWRLGKWAYFTPDKKLSKQFWKVNMEFNVKTDKLFKVKGDSSSDVLTEIKSKFPEADEFNMAEILQKNWYDWIDYTDRDKWRMVSIFDPEKIKKLKTSK